MGYTTRNHLCLDLDNTSYPKALSLAYMLMRYYPYVGDCLILESSTPDEIRRVNYTPQKGLRIHREAHNYHLVFNNFISYELCCIIIETLAYLGVINEEYVRIREMRNDMTLRLSETVLTTGIKPKPRVRARLHNPYTEEKGYMIENYLRFYLAVNP